MVPVACIVLLKISQRANTSKASIQMNTPTIEVMLSIRLDRSTRDRLLAPYLPAIEITIAEVNSRRHVGSALLALVKGVFLQHGTVWLYSLESKRQIDRGCGIVGSRRSTPGYERLGCVVVERIPPRGQKSTTLARRDWRTLVTLRSHFR